MEKGIKIVERTIVVSLILLSSALIIFGAGVVVADEGPSLPGVPIGLTAVPGNENVILQWTAPASVGSSAIDYYIIYRETGYTYYNDDEFFPGSSVNETEWRVGIELPDDPTILMAKIIGLPHQDLTLDYIWTYRFTVAAHNEAGIGPKSVPAISNPFTTPYEGFWTEIDSGDGQVHIDWYLHMFSRNSDGGSPILFHVIYQDGVDIMHVIPLPQGGNATITGLTNGQSYNFSVALHNAAGDGPHSNVTAVPMATPDAPTGLSATSDNGNVSLTWSAPANSAGSFIEGYNVYQDGIKVGSSRDTSITVTGLTNNHTYIFSVSAYNALNYDRYGLWNEGPRSSGVLATPGPESSSAPTGLTAMPGNAQIGLSWLPPENDGGAEIDYYVVYQNDIDVMHVNGNSEIIVGLINGQSYSFTISAHNYVGLSPKSSAVQATPYTVPDAPTGYAAVPGNGQVIFNWAAPNIDGGRSIDYYIMYQDGIALPYHLSGPSTTISGLVNGQTYSFTISAHNLAGIGPQSITKLSTPYSLPDAPTGLNAVPGNSQVSLNWTAPAFDGGSAIDHYVIYQDGIELPDHYQVFATNITGLNVSEWYGGQTYSFTVAAHNAAGTGPQCDLLTAIPYTTPSTVIHILISTGDGYVSLAWWNPEGNGGSIIQYYVICLEGVDIVHTPNRSVKINDLTNGHSNNFSIAAHNAAGDGPYSIVSAIPMTVPGAPTDLIATSGNGQVLLTWNGSSNLGELSIAGFFVYQDGVKVAQTPDESIGISGLTNGQTYNFTITSRYFDTRGQGSPPEVESSPSVVFATPRADTAGNPTGLIATPGEWKVDLSWLPPENDGGAEIDYYVVYQNDIDVKHFIATSGTITGLVNGELYSFTAAAHNAAGTSAQSRAVQATPYTVPNAPTSLTATTGNTFVTLRWDVPSDNGGMAIDHYVVDQDGTEIFSNLTGLTCNITGLTNGQSRNFSIAAYNSAGIGPYSYVIVTPTQTVPSEPLNVSMSTIDSGIVLQWSLPVDNGGYSITYLIFRGTSTGTESPLVNSSGNSYTDKAIALGTNYYYFVKAVNQLGTSIPSNEIGPVSASTAINLEMETDSVSSSIGIVITITGDVKTMNGGMPVSGLNVDLCYSVNNGLTWIEMSSVDTSSAGNFSSQWIPTATSVYMLKGTWAGNAAYQASTSIMSLAITSSSDKIFFTVQSNSTISNLSFNSDNKKLRFNVSGETGTYGYSRIVISKELVANGSEIKVSLDGSEMNCQLSSTGSSWILYFMYHHSSHKIVADLDILSSIEVKGDSPNSVNTDTMFISVLVIGCVFSALFFILRRQKDKQEGDN